MSGYVIWNREYGYYNGKILFGEDIFYPAASMIKTAKEVKVYTSEKRAINAAEKIKSKCMYFEDYRILPY